MKYVSYGKGTLPLISLIALLSVSLTVNLPGLAVSPLLGKLSDLFPHASQLEVQLLTLLPNLVIIPMILVAGKITSIRNQSVVLAIGLSIFLLSGILYFFADTMPVLVGLGVLLGIGCGLIVPIAAGLLSEWFYGKEKVKVLGFKSGTSNGIVILATVFVGWAAARSWHAAFAVYLVPVIPLALLPFMTNTFIRKHMRPDAAPSDSGASQTSQSPSSAATPDPGSHPLAHAKDGVAAGHSQQSAAAVHALSDSTATATSGFKKPLLTLAGVILLYIGLTATSMVFTYYLPFTMKHYGLSTSEVGVATAMFYVTAMIGGFSLTPYIRVTGRIALYVCIVIMTAGVLILGCIHTMAGYVVGVLLIGIGYGFFQPIIYNKTTILAPTKEASTKYFSYVLAGNYIAVACVPVVVEFFQWLFKNHTANFPYFLNAGILGIIFVIGLLLHKSFVWRTGKDAVK